MTLPKPTSTVTYVEGFAPGYLSRIAQMHGEYYAGIWGSGVDFEVQTTREICDYYECYDTEHDLLLTAHIDGVLVGSVAILGSQSGRPDLARLRWFLLDERYQGQGIGSALLSRALEFCRTHGFPGVYLWTVEGLPASRHLYEKFGFRVVERYVDDRYTVQHTHLLMEKPL